MKYVLILAVLLWSAPALATDDIWVTDPQGTRACIVERNGYCYYDTALDAATPIQRTTECDEITATWISLITDNSDVANTAQVFSFFGDAQDRTADSNDDEAIAVEAVTLTGLGPDADTIYAFDAPAVYFRVNNSSGVGRAILHCIK